MFTNDATRPNLRKAHADDRDAVMRAVTAAYQGTTAALGYKPTAATANYVHWIEDGGVWVLDRGGDIIGVIVLLEGPDGLLVYSVAIIPGEQRHGLGTHLMEFAQETARLWSAPQIILYTDEKAADTIRLFERLGYDVYDRLPHPTRAKTFLIHMRKTV